MDAFEKMVGEILYREGYWVRTAVKVDLTREEKRAIKRPSSPRWELDIVGYSAKRNELLVVECKSYLDSRGVAYNAFDGSYPAFAKRFKLFNDATVRRVVLNRLRRQMSASGFTDDKREATVELALVCGKIASDSDRDKLRQHFADNRWILWDDCWLKQKLQEIANGGYENSEIAMVSKLLLGKSKRHVGAP